VVLELTVHPRMGTSGRIHSLGSIIRISAIPPVGGENGSVVEREYGVGMDLSGIQDFLHHNGEIFLWGTGRKSVACLSVRSPVDPRDGWSLRVYVDGKELPRR